MSQGSAAPAIPPPVDQVIASILGADTGPLQARFGPPPVTESLGFSAWPWEIASKGASYLKDHIGSATALAKAGNQLPSSPGGASAISAVSSGPKDSSNTDRVLDNGIFTNALNQLKPDALLRTIFIGWAGGAQIGIFGGGGGGGVAYDIIDHSNHAGVTYGAGSIGLGARVDAGLLLGAMTRQPSGLNSSTAVFEVGASFIGIAALVAVIMDLDLGLIGLTLNVGTGFGVSGSTGYGKISAG